MRQDTARHRRDRTDADFALLQPAQSVQRIDRLCHFEDEQSCVRNERLTGSGRLHAHPDALEQCLPQSLFDPLDQAAERGLAEVDRQRSAPESAGIDDGKKAFDIARG